MTTAYLGLDLHATTCTLGIMADDGTYLGHQHFPTAESDLIPRLVEINAPRKSLALEEGTVARWAARIVDEEELRELTSEVKGKHRRRKKR